LYEKEGLKMNIKEVEALCYAIIANASELDVLDGSMTLLNDVIEWIKLNIENEKEEEDFKKLQKAYDLILEVKSSYYGGNNDTNKI